MQVPIAKHWMEVRNFYGRVGGRIEDLKGDRNSTGRPAESGQPGPLGALGDRTTNQIAYMGWTECPPHLCRNMQLCLHVGGGNNWREAVPDLVACL